MAEPVVRYMNADTGEIKERAWSGVDSGVMADGEPYEHEWETTALELALALVPDLEIAIDLAHMKGMDCEVHVRRVPRA